jgi:hypothetical protein
MVLQTFIISEAGMLTTDFFPTMTVGSIYVVSNTFRIKIANAFNYPG